MDELATIDDVMTMPQPSRLVFELAGERQLNAIGTIDSHTAEELLAELQGLGTDADVTLGLEQVEFIDSSGLRSIVVTHQAFDDAGTRLVLASPSEAVKRLLDITGLTDYLHIG